MHVSSADADPVPAVTAIDLFCGVGGLSAGLQQSGINVICGIDIDDTCKFPFETNIGAPYLSEDVRNISAQHFERLWGSDDIRLLAGCAPCQPFSSYRRGVDTSAESQWPLLADFGRLVRDTNPHVVTMENVPRVASSKIFKEFVSTLIAHGFEVDFASRDCATYGLPQRRRRLVLIASRVGRIKVPHGNTSAANVRTVRDCISSLPEIESGGAHTEDSLHKSRKLSDLNLKRIQASKPGGTWEDWPVDLRAPCHQRATGASFRNVYARMNWDQPAPTITTLAHNFGAGRFGHPDQDRPISLREAAMLQGFPRDYTFTRAEDPVYFATLGRLIGNAVPPPVGRAVGDAVMQHLSERSGKA